MNGTKSCKVSTVVNASICADVGNINSYFYLQHEFEQAKKRNKIIIMRYNSLYKQSNWLPGYFSDYEDEAHLFWEKGLSGKSWVITYTLKGSWV